MSDASAATAQDHVLATFKVAGVWFGYFVAINWGGLAAFLSCVATVFVILNQAMAALDRLKKRRALVGVRTPQDE